MGNRLQEIDASGLQARAGILAEPTGTRESCEAWVEEEGGTN